jgi:hypothetical protein
MRCTRAARRHDALHKKAGWAKLCKKALFDGLTDHKQGVRNWGEQLAIRKTCADNAPARRHAADCGAASRQLDAGAARLGDRASERRQTRPIRDER